MGDRALVIMTDREEVGPVAYLHWGGESVPALIERTKTLMNGRKGDVQYSAARFVGIAHSDSPDSNTGMGLWNTPQNIQDAVKNLFDEKAEPGAVMAAKADLAKYSHGDAGVIVVDVHDYTWEAHGGYLKNWDHEAGKMKEEAA